MKVHEYNTTQQNGDFVFQWSQVLLWQKNYAQFRVLFMKKPESEQELSDYYGFQLNQAIRSFADNDFGTFLNSVQRIPLADVKDLTEVTTLKDLGTYFILAALRTLTPSGN